MYTLVLVPLEESMAQRDAGKHEQWRGYMTVLVVNHGMIKSISILTGIICVMIKCDVQALRNRFCRDVHWILAIL